MRQAGTAIRKGLGPKEQGAAQALTLLGDLTSRAASIRAWCGLWPKALPVRTVERKAADDEANGFSAETHGAVKPLRDHMQVASSSPMGLDQILPQLCALATLSWSSAPGLGGIWKMEQRAGMQEQRNDGISVFQLRSSPLEGTVMEDKDVSAARGRHGERECRGRQHSINGRDTHALS